MRYKRNNTLALDLSVLKTFPGIEKIRKILECIKLTPADLKCVQLHSSRKIVYVGLQESVSAADIARKFNLKYQCHISDNTYIRIPIVYVEDDVVDVRVRDVPPEVPNEIIGQALRQHGEVITVTNETWENFFPGLLTGGRIVRMKVTSNIPSFFKIGNSLARITYSGQTETCRCNLPSHKGFTCKAAKERKSMEPAQPTATCGSEKENTQQKASDSSGSTPAKPATDEAAENMELEDTASPFTVFTRKRGKMTNRGQNNDSDSSSAELDENTLIHLSEGEAFKLGPENFEKWLTIKGGSKIFKIAKKH